MHISENTIEENKTLMNENTVTNTGTNTNTSTSKTKKTLNVTKTLKTTNKLWFVKNARSLIFIAYLSVVVAVMCFHEPWFDEAQSWLIARDSSFADLLLGNSL